MFLQNHHHQSCLCVCTPWEEEEEAIRDEDEKESIAWAQNEGKVVRSVSEKMMKSKEKR